MSGLQIIAKRRLASLNCFDFAWMTALVLLALPLAFSWKWWAIIALGNFVGAVISVALETVAARS